MSGGEWGRVRRLQHTPPDSGLGLTRRGRAQLRGERLGGEDAHRPLEVGIDDRPHELTPAARPAGSTLTDADIQDNTSALASFKADVTGTYAVRLVVRDGMLSDSVTLPGLVVGVLHDNDPLDDLGRAPVNAPGHMEEPAANE